MSKRYGNCQKKHAEVTIKSVIRSWAKDLQGVDGIARSKKEIEIIVADQIENLNNYEACNWTGCEYK